MVSFLPVVGRLPRISKARATYRKVQRALSEALENRQLMSANWTGPDPTQITAYDLGSIHGDVNPVALSLSNPGDTLWFKYTIGTEGAGLNSVLITDPSGHTQGHLIAPSGSTIDFDDNHSVLDTAPAGSVYYLEVTGVGGQTSDSFTISIHTQGTGSTTPGPGDARPIQTQRAAFITQLFLDTLHRLPDANGLDSWVQGLAQNAVTAGQVASDLINSTEFRTNTIQSLYQSILGRSADQNGLNVWLGFFASGGTVEQMKAQFYGSDEFFNSVGGSNTDLVTAFYRGFLGRDPEPAGLAVWVGQLEQGSPRSTVAESIENLSLEGARGIVTRAYETFLRREPDALFSNWIAQVQAGTSVLALDISLLGSQEYFNGASDGAYGT